MILAIDTEYEPVNPAWAKLRSYSYSLEDKSARFVEWDQEGRARAHLQSLLDSADTIVMHNQVSDSTILSQHGVIIPYSKLHCTLVMAHTLACFKSISLKSLGYELLGRHWSTFEETMDGRDIMTLPASEFYEYACTDADVTRRLYPILKERLLKEGLWHIYEDIERPLFQIVVSMQLEGVVVDWDHLKKLGVEYESVAATLREELITASNGQVKNPNSTKQASAFIYGTLGYPKQKNKEGRVTFDSKAVARLRTIKSHPFLDKYPLFKQTAKLKSTYTDGLPHLMCPHPGCGRLHPVFKQFGAATGRFSSEWPNFQNLPVRTEQGARIREAFTVPPGALWLGVDASQLELRTLAAITRDPKLTAFFQECAALYKHERAARLDKGDIHSWVAQLAGIPRRPTKILTYGRMFGQGKRAAYTELCVAALDAGETPPSFATFEVFHRKHAEILSALPRWEAMCRQSILNKGYVETFYGRRVYTSDLQGGGWRSALSQGPQGTAADWIKLTMPRVFALCSEYKYSLFGQVHDELNIVVPPEALTRPGHVGTVHAFRHQLKRTMEETVRWQVPVEVEIKVGRTWSQAH